jgi:hypothetical protein
MLLILLEAASFPNIPEIITILTGKRCGWKGYSTVNLIAQVLMN